MKKIALLSTAILFSCTFSFAQNIESRIKQYLSQNQKSLKLENSDLKLWEIYDQHTDAELGLTYVYVHQTFDGIPVHNATATFVLNKDSVVLSGNRLTSNIAGQINATSAKISAETALINAARILNIETIETPQLLSHRKGIYLFEKGTISQEQIPVSLVFVAANNGIRLAWDLNIYVSTSEHWWSIRIDAITGEEIEHNDWVANCNFDGLEHAFQHKHGHIDGQSTSLLMLPMPPSADQYNVFALPVESPNHGTRTLEVGPYDVVASPFGWHDTNGSAGAEYTITRGNNVLAQDDMNGNNGTGYSPDGGASLNFNFPLNMNQAANNYLDAAVTNLFYMNNKMHDIWYHYGFNEASGNFQENNYGNGGNGGDYVLADAQDGSGTNNANFATPNDGSNPRMQMYLWDNPGTQTLTVNSPTGLAGNYPAIEATFGPGLPVTPITADFAIFNDATPDTYDACSAATNAGALSGKIVIIRRGTCNFVTKVTEAQNAGALAVIMVNNVAGAPFAMGGTGPGITIPSVMVSNIDGEAFIAALEGGTTLNGSLAAPGNFDLDGDFDNGIVAHEYGHGISNRLTGGASNSNCLGNAEQMGEGWSDWFALMITMNPGDVSTDNRGMGTWVMGESTSGIGIRPVPYNTDFAVNDYTYGNTNGNALSQPHGIGFVWCTMLWDMTWAFIDAYGYDPDLYNGAGGNNMTMELVIQGLKLQPCSPGFVDGRDAILQADMLLNGGANQCLIWNVFANRGLGQSASQGSTNNRNDQVEAFDLPSWITNVTNTVSETACGSYTWSGTGQTYTSSGTYVANLFTSTGCDSTVTLNLTITAGVNGSTTNVSNCTPYTWSANGTTYAASGTYTATLTNSLGCDSIITLNLTIGSGTSGTDVVSSCSAYTWIDGNTYNASNNTATHILTNSAGCDSVVTLNFTLNPGYNTSNTVNACANYTWPANGTTYTNSGNYTANLLSTSGCDSIVTLSLSITNTASSTQTETACGSYTWGANNNTYSNSGTFVETLTAQSGCDSIVTLNLTIAQPNASTETATNCGSYTWATNGSTYSNSGLYTATLTNSVGCDSIVTLDLTILDPSAATTNTASACDSYVWGTTNTTYTASGVYSETLVNLAGCDSVVSLDLTINPSYSSSETTTACDLYVWNANGTTYTSSGTYTEIYTSNAGCDSTFTLQLIIESVDASASMLDEVTLSATSNSGTYQWLDCSNGNVAIAGETDQIFNPTNNGDYAVIVTENGCSDTSACMTVNKIGLNELSSATITLQPNPTNGTFSIHFGQTYEIAEIKCLDALGQLIEEKTAKNTDQVDWYLNTPPGVYFMEITIAGFETQVLRVVKQ